MKRVLGFFLSFVFLFAFTVTVFAQSPNAQIPEKNGDFPDPDHPGVRVRVFVHEPKEKPQASNSSICENPNTFVSTIGATGWKLPSQLRYKINTGSVPSSVGGSNLQNLVSGSFASWTGVIAASAPTLIYDGTTTKSRKALDGQNIITWGRTTGSALGVTYTWYYPSTGLVAEVDTIMNQKFPWVLDACSSSAYEARNILTHELGHWFGLNDEYGATYVDNTMYGYGSKAETKKITPESGDITGINLIYH